MGHNVKKTKADVQKELLKCVFTNLIDTTKHVLRFQLTLTDNPKEIEGIRQLIRHCDKSKLIIRDIEHIEILISLYNSFIAMKENYYVVFSETVANKKKITRWDKTKKGFKEFMELESKAIAQTQKELEQKKKEQEMIANARAQGKKVEMILKDGKLKPVIVESKPN